MNMEPKSLNEWWDKQPDELKQAFTFYLMNAGKRQTCI
mgnify:CR=1 FL=1